MEIKVTIKNLSISLKIILCKHNTSNINTLDHNILVRTMGNTEKKKNTQLFVSYNVLCYIN